MKGKKILVVEDEHIVAMGIKRMLKSLGCQVTGIASTGEDAVCKAESTFPDLVLMDIMLKGKLGGLKAAEEIQTRFNTPVIYITACSDKNIRAQAEKTGAFGYITKPFDENELADSIETALKNHEAEKKSSNMKTFPELIISLPSDLVPEGQ
ncbi:response regulator [Methanosarcina sp. Mfa9]|uniref:response regulator n=1 Tax=Methanosarcina sp. Mfa9 TaxID=3439063 RepID=UPI003F829177